MTDQKNNDAEFDAYLKGQSHLSEIYQKDVSKGPSDSTDHAILAAARQEVKKYPSGAQGRRLRWYVPAALAASLVVVITLIYVTPLNNSSTPDQISENDKRSTNDQYVASGKPAPEIMLDKINKLLDEGKIKDARHEYDLFTELFPHHEIDFKKYPNLQKLKTK